MRVVDNWILDDQSLIIHYICKGPDALISLDGIIGEGDVCLHAYLIPKH